MPVLMQLSRVDRFVDRLDQDARREALIRLIHTSRGEGWLWSDLTLALADAIDGIRTERLHHMFADYAGPYKLWEAVMHVIAEAWDQERTRAREEKEGERLRTHARDAVAAWRQRWGIH